MDIEMAKQILVKLLYIRLHEKYQCVQQLSNRFMFKKREGSKGLFSRPSARLYGPGSSVGIATGYGLDGLGIELRRERDFPHLSRPALGTYQPPLQ
jgi:hypothetical protein